MAATYTALPSSDLHERRSTSPDSPPPKPKPLYLPPYDVDSYSPFLNDIEHDAPQRPRYRLDPLPAFDSDPRFKMETPSPITRAALIVFVCFLFWLAFNLRKGVWMATGGMGMEKEGREMVDLSY